MDTPQGTVRPYPTKRKAVKSNNSKVAFLLGGMIGKFPGGYCFENDPTRTNLNLMGLLQNFFGKFEVPCGFIRFGRFLKGSNLFSAEPSTPGRFVQPSISCKPKASGIGYNGKPGGWLNGSTTFGWTMVVVSTPQWKIGVNMGIFPQFFWVEEKRHDMFETTWPRLIVTKMASSLRFNIWCTYKITARMFTILSFQIHKRFMSESFCRDIWINDWHNPGL